MGLNIKPSTSRERKALAIETILNTTDKVCVITDESVLSGVAGAISTASGTAEKDIILAMSQMFPDLAADSSSDQVASYSGFKPY